MKTQIEKITPVLAAGLVRLAKSNIVKKLAEEVRPGEYPLDATVRLAGVVKKGKDIEDAVTSQAIPWQKLCVALLNRTNFATRATAISQVMNGEEQDLKPDVKKEVEALKNTTRATKKGRLTGDVVPMTVWRVF